MKEVREKTGVFFSCKLKIYLKLQCKIAWKTAFEIKGNSFSTWENFAASQEVRNVSFPENFAYLLTDGS